MFRGIRTIRCLAAMLFFMSAGAYAATTVDVYQDPG